MKHTSLTITVAVITAALGFGGGLFFQKSRDSLKNVSPQYLPAKLQSLGLTSGMGTNRTSGGGNGNGGFFARGMGHRGGGGLINGQVISKDNQSITVKMADGSTKVAYYSASTAIGKSTPGTASDLSVGQTVMANGTPNSDGSVTAQNIQIRPAATPSPTATQ